MIVPVCEITQVQLVFLCRSSSCCRWSMQCFHSRHFVWLCSLPSQQEYIIRT